MKKLSSPTILYIESQELFPLQTKQPDEFANQHQYLYQSLPSTSKTEAEREVTTQLKPKALHSMLELSFYFDYLLSFFLFDNDYIGTKLGIILLIIKYYLSENDIFNIN